LQKQQPASSLLVQTLHGWNSLGQPLFAPDRPARHTVSQNHPGSVRKSPQFDPKQNLSDRNSGVRFVLVRFF
jgi:hypothetical protein